MEKKMENEMEAGIYMRNIILLGSTSKKKRCSFGALLGGSGGLASILICFVTRVVGHAISTLSLLTASP